MFLSLSYKMPHGISENSLSPLLANKCLGIIEMNTGETIATINYIDGRLSLFNEIFSYYIFTIY